MKIRLFDIETDGLLKYSCTAENGANPVSKIHCIVIHDYETETYHRFGPDKIQEALDMLMDSDLLVAHNGIKYDVPVIEFLYPDFKFPHEKILDTLTISRLIYSDIKDSDNARLRQGTLPGKLYGSHSLKAWGYRLGVLKGSYGESEDAWAEFNEEMLDYCENDVLVTRKLFDKLTQDTHYFGETFEGAIYAVRLEHDVAWLMAQQERNGFPFGEDDAQALYAQLAGLRQGLLDDVVATFGTWYKPVGKEIFKHPRTGAPLPKYPMVKYPKVGGIFKKDGTLDTRDYVAGCPYTPLELVQFNPGSQQHIAKVLKERGWEPTEFTPTGQASIDADILAEVRLADPEAQAAVDKIVKYLTVQKRLGQIAEGDNAWLKLCKDGFIHGSVNTNGAVTGRATHAFPNIAQVPAKDKLYGPECRNAFGTRHLYRALSRRYGKAVADRWKEALQVGSDASGLELRCLAHFMCKYDEGKYINEVLNGDVHWTNVLALGFFPVGTLRDKHNDSHEAHRGYAKTFIYAFLYGAGDEKIGSIVPGGDAQKGKALKKAFMAATPAIKMLRDAIEGQLVESSRWVDGEQKIKWRRKYLKGLDGRKLNVRSPHSALNTLLQSAGALICKEWIVRTERLMIARGYKHGWVDGDFCYMAWVHDEIQVACRNAEVAAALKECSQEAMRATGEFFKFRCTLDTDSNEGQSWLDCH
jgi:hypothetical protein